MNTWQHLIRLAWNFKWGLSSVLIIVVLNFAVLQHVVALVIREVFDTLTAKANATFDIATLMGFLVALAFAKVVLFYGSTAVQAYVHFAVGSAVRRNILNHLLNRPLDSALPGSPSEMISRFREDVDELPTYVLRFSTLISTLLFAGFAAYMMIKIDALIAFAIVLPFVVVLFVLSVMSKRVSSARRLSRSEAGEVAGFVGEMFGVVEAVKTSKAESRMLGQLERLNAQRRLSTVKDVLLVQTLGATFRNAVNLGTGVILLLAARSIGSDSMTVGDFSLFVFYLHHLAWLVSEVGWISTRYRHIGVSVERLETLMEDGAAKSLVGKVLANPPGKLPALPLKDTDDGGQLATLEVAGLTYRFPESEKGVYEAEFSLDRGTFTVITGSVGSGKTTLLRVLLGLLHRQAGELRWNNIAVDDPREFMIPPRCGYVPQVPRLFTDTLRDNILLGLPEDKDRLDRAIWMSAMERDMNLFTYGLDTVVGPRGVRLSGGQLKRVAAARTFFREPELLVIDDVSSGLDVETESVLWSRLFEQVDYTCLVVSHRRTALSRADSILLLRDGRLTQGSLSELLKSSQEMRRLWHGTE